MGSKRPEGGIMDHDCPQETQEGKNRGEVTRIKNIAQNKESSKNTMEILVNLSRSAVADT